MLVTHEAVELGFRSVLAIDEKGNLAVVPVKQNVELVPSVCIVLHVHELLRVDLECLVVAHPVENRRDESALLPLVFVEGQLMLADILRFVLVEDPSRRLRFLSLLLCKLKEAQVAAFRVRI